MLVVAELVDIEKVFQILQQGVYLFLRKRIQLLLVQEEVVLKVVLPLNTPLDLEVQDLILFSLLLLPQEVVQEQADQDLVLFPVAVVAVVEEQVFLLIVLILQMEEQVTHPLFHLLKGTPVVLFLVVDTVKVVLVEAVLEVHQ